MRFDVPGAGTDTLRAMIEIGAAVLAVEAEKTILIGKDRLIKEADRAGISLVGHKDDID
jgi:hypothetical protein